MQKSLSSGLGQLTELDSSIGPVVIHQKAVMKSLEVIVDNGSGMTPMPVRSAAQSPKEEAPSTGAEGKQGTGPRPNYSVLVARLAIITLFAVSVSLLTIFTWFWTSQSTKNAVNSLGSSIRHEILNRSAGHMLRVLSDQAAALHSTEEACYYQYQLTGAVMGEQMRRQVWGVVSNRNYDLKCSTHDGSGKYSYVNPETVSGVRRYTEVFSNTTTPLGGWQMAYKVSLDANGQRLGQAAPFETVPDKRLRPYYTGAHNLSAGDVFWSTLYSDQQFPVMVASTPLRDNVSGTFLGVNAVSQALRDLSDYSSLFDLKGGVLYFKTADDVLLAKSGPIDDFLIGGRLRRANESLNPTVRAAEAFVTETWGLQHLLSTRTEAADVTLGKLRYYVDTVPIRLNNLMVVAVVAIPRTSIMGVIDERSRATVIFLVSLSVAIFALGCVLVVFFTVRVSREVKLKAELDAAKRRAEAHSQAKSMFLSNVSHELRTPMAGIMGLLDLLAAEELQPEQAVNVAQIKQCATSLLGLLNNLLDLGKIEAGRLELEKADFDITAELESIVDMFAVQCSKKGIEIGLDLPGDMDRLVKGDQARVRQVVVNLLSNAVKFSSVGGHILVRAWPIPFPQTELAPAGPPDSPNAKTPRENGGWFSPCSPSPKSAPPVPSAAKRGYTFEVDDSGIGIPPEKREKVFENFVQADSSTTRTHGGTGLGLGIVRSLVRMMGGDIQIVDKDGPGTLMRFTIYFEESETAAEQPGTSLDDVREGHVFLAMEGDVGRGIAERYLTAQGLTVQTVRTLGAHPSELLAGHDVEAGQPVFMLLDASALDGAILGDLRNLQAFLAELSALQHKASIAWLTSPSTPSPVRQLLKSAFPVASKPLYNTRLSTLLRLMIARSGASPFCNTPESQHEETLPLENRNVFGAVSGADTASELSAGSDSSRFTETSSLLPTSPLISPLGGALGTHLKPAPRSSSHAEASSLAAGGRQTPLRRAQSQPLAGLRVLVAEDTPILQKLAVKMLTKLGASVHCVEDGQQAAAAVIGSGEANHQNAFDAVLMDCQMPNVDGYQATEAIRQAEAGLGRYTPIIALTAHAMASDRDKCLACGMDGYLSKPILQKDLVSTLTSVIKDRKRET
ncbi:Signal transduction histidine kinase [Klebsormidium nitens]|uniref:Signal transduction histidine kinase n=1 Tax=Klebsormidium nitens TaxID=105231 RepID=A0A1Y1IHS1_KLENI|nr:Signal transduction histidine kinase [Klebsormidium nitens]|eukprot:GAQ88197.1 Signal transduction histidine kinase [Klebsormidium nitens]